MTLNSFYIPLAHTYLIWKSLVLPSVIVPPTTRWFGFLLRLAVLQNYVNWKKYFWIAFIWKKKKRKIYWSCFHIWINFTSVRDFFWGMVTPYPFTEDDILEVLRIPNKLTYLCLDLPKKTKTKWMNFFNFVYWKGSIHLILYLHQGSRKIIDSKHQIGKEIKSKKSIDSMHCKNLLYKQNSANRRYFGKLKWNFASGDGHSFSVPSTSVIAAEQKVWWIWKYQNIS